MRTHTRWLVVAIITAGISLANVPAGAARPEAQASTACHRLFWMGQGVRYARRIYEGTRKTKVRQMHHLGRIERCQHNNHAERYVRHQAHQLRRAHRARVAYMNSHPWQDSTVSWYNDAGTTASGWHATYGVADCGTDGVCYPFGTRIEFCYHGCIVATVDDHGPYVAGRDYDLNQNTAQAIGATGVESVRWRLA